MAVFPSAGRARRAGRPRSARPLDAPHRAARAGAGRDRTAPQGQADRQLAAGEGHPVGRRRRAGVPRGARARAADAVHRVGRRAAAGGRPASAPSSSSAPAASNASGAGATCRPCRRTRPRRASAIAARTRWPPPLMSEDTAGQLPAPPRRLETLAADRDRRARSAHEGDRPVDGAARRERGDRAGVRERHARAEHRRRVRAF